MNVIKYISLILITFLSLNAIAQTKVKEQVIIPTELDEKDFIEKNYFDRDNNLLRTQYSMNNQKVYERKWVYGLNDKVAQEWNIRYSENENTPPSYDVSTFQYINDSLISEEKSLSCSSFNIDKSCTTNFTQRYFYNNQNKLIKVVFLDEFEKEKSQKLYYYPNKSIRIKEYYPNIKKNGFTLNYNFIINKAKKVESSVVYIIMIAVLQPIFPIRITD